MRKVQLLALVIVSIAALSACSISVGPADPGIADEVDYVREATITNGGPLADEVPLHAHELRGGESVVYEIEVPSTSEPALFFYISEPLNLYVYDGSEDLYASSSTTRFFASGSGGIGVGSASTSIETKVVNEEICPFDGACVIAPANGRDTFYVEVVNSGSSARTYSIYSVVRGFADENESWSASDPMPIFEFDTEAQGAIETIRDEDYFVVEQGGFMSLEYGRAGETGIEIEAELVPFDGAAAESFEPGESIGVFAGDEIRVRAVNSRAAVAGMSTYDLFLE